MDDSISSDFSDSNPKDAYAEMIHIAAKHAEAPSKRANNDSKPCCKCHKAPRTPGNKWCKSCANAYKRSRYTTEAARREFLKRKYKLTPEDYELMFFRQGGVCAACGQPQIAIDAYTKKTKVLNVDHNHETGQTRELLCDTCNKLLGFIEKDRERVKKLVRYLKRHDM